MKQNTWTWLCTGLLGLCAAGCGHWGRSIHVKHMEDGWREPDRWDKLVQDKMDEEGVRRILGEPELVCEDTPYLVLWRYPGDGLVGFRKENRRLFTWREPEFDRITLDLTKDGGKPGADAGTVRDGLGVTKPAQANLAASPESGDAKTHGQMATSELQFE